MSVQPASVARSADRPPAWSWSLVPAALVSASAFALYGVQERWIGYGLLVAALAIAAIVDRPLAKHLALVAAGLAIISLTTLKADLSNSGMVRIFTALTLALVVPFVISRVLLRERVIVFPSRSGQRWSRLEWGYLALVLLLGYFVLPLYFIRSGVYHNWPAVPDADQIFRLFLGVNFVGLWDELFFICTVFAIFRQHFRFWQANLLQAVVFSSFLWELGYQFWGPALTFPFALLQGYVFQRTRSVPYIVTIHLSFDAIIFMILVHAHNPELFGIFVTAP